MTSHRRRWRQPGDVRHVPVAQHHGPVPRTAGAVSQRPSRDRLPVRLPRRLPARHVGNAARDVPRDERRPRGHWPPTADSRRPPRRVPFVRRPSPGHRHTGAGRPRQLVRPLVRDPSGRRLETYNPILMLLLPAAVGRHLGRRTIEALAANERRLVSMRDVHLCLRHFLSVATGSGRATPAGLSGDVPADRTCDDLSIAPLAYCVCRDGSVAKPSDDWYAIVAEFAVGALNDVILTQYQAALPGGASKQSLPSSCRLLVPLKFGNVTEKYEKVGVSDF